MGKRGDWKGNGWCALPCYWKHHDIQLEQLRRQANGLRPDSDQQAVSFFDTEVRRHDGIMIAINAHWGSGWHRGPDFSCPCGGLQPHALSRVHLLAGVSAFDVNQTIAALLAVKPSDVHDSAENIRVSR